MSKLIFNVHENHIEIAWLQKIFNLVKIKNVVSFTPQEDIETNNIELKRILMKNKIKSKNVEVILSIDGIVTRQIEVPAMKEKDLKNFIENNIGQYFTVNTRNFYFDYKVMGIRKEEKKKIFSILFVAIPKEKLQKMRELLKLNGLKLSKVKIYPECLVNYYSKNKKLSIAVLDVGFEKSTVTILDKGEIFIYSTITTDLSEEDDYNELLDSFTYFLNFYATRHFGNKLDKVFIVGERSEDEKLIKILNENIDINITYEERNYYVEISGSCVDVKAIYNKTIDFKETLREKQDTFFIPIVIGIIIIAATGMGAYYYTEIDLNTNKNTVTPSLQLELSKYSGVDKEINDLNNEKQNYQKKIDVINGIKDDEFDYLSIIDGLKKGLPKSITVKSMEIERGKTKVSLNINKNTLDVARAVIAINNTKLFETVDISEVKLDDTVDSISLDLIIKNPS